MENIEKFDPSQLMQGVKDRIKATFVSLIPDEQWEGMVQTEIDSFFNSETKTLFTLKEESPNSHWGSNVSQKKYSFEFTGEMSPFRQMVYMFCVGETNAALNNEMTKQYFTSEFDENTGENINTKMREVIKESLPGAINKFFTDILLNVMSNNAFMMQNALINFNNNNQYR